MLLVKLGANHEVGASFFQVLFTLGSVSSFPSHYFLDFITAHKKTYCLILLTYYKKNTLYYKKQTKSNFAYNKFVCNFISKGMTVIFIAVFILCFLMNIVNAMENSIVTTIDPDIKRIIREEFPCSFHNHLRIIDEIEKEDNGCSLLKNNKVFIFNGLADYLHGHGLEFLRKWRDSPVSLEEIRKICRFCIEDDWIIDAWEGDDIFFSMHVACMRLNYRFTLEDFAFYTFFKPCFDYYSLAKETSNMAYEYDQKIKTAKGFFRDSFPNTTLVEGRESQKECVNDCPLVATSTKCPSVAGIISQKKLIRSLSGKRLSLLSGKCSSPLSPRVSKKPFTVRGKK